VVVEEKEAREEMTEKKKDGGERGMMDLCSKRSPTWHRSSYRL